MKLEKLSDNQIRCTLNRTDLAERELKISELAYGTEKAKDLFREMMQQASFEFGFEAEDIPLMIEAIPVSADCIILIITKVNDPEELDTRFSKFSPSPDEPDEDISSENEEDEIASLFSKIQEIRDSLELSDEDMEQIEDIDSSGSTGTADDFIPFKESLKKAAQNKSEKDADDNAAGPKKMTRIFKFASLDKVSCACEYADPSCDILSSLYKDPVNSLYYLVLTFEGESTENFNRTCNAISEFGTRIKSTYATEAYYKEHLETIIKCNALTILKNL